MRWWSYLFPIHPNCWFCNQPKTQTFFSSSWSNICKDCLSLLSPIQNPTCRVCFRSLEEDSDICRDCVLVAIEDRVRNVSAVSYTSKTKKVISRFKYLGDERYAKYIGAMMRDMVEVHYRGIPFSMVTNVPLHHKRLTERGFNQSQLLAEQIGKSIGIPASSLLERNKPSAPQASLGRAERIRSLQNSFRISEEAKQLDLRPHTLLLVDDVYTTGSTIRECAKVLRNAGAQTIYAVTFAR